LSMNDCSNYMPGWGQFDAQQDTVTQGGGYHKIGSSSYAVANAQNLVSPWFPSNTAAPANWPTGVGQDDNRGYTFSQYVPNSQPGPFAVLNWSFNYHS